MTVRASGQRDGPEIHWALPAGVRICVRVTKETDQKFVGLCPQGFESPRCRMSGCNAVLFGREKERRAVAITALFLGLCHGACSVAATYKPPMLVPRVRLPADAHALQQSESIKAVAQPPMFMRSDKVGAEQVSTGNNTRTHLAPGSSCFCVFLFKAASKLAHPRFVCMSLFKEVHKLFKSLSLCKQQWGPNGAHLSLLPRS